MKPEANKPSRIPRAHEQKPALPSDSLADAGQVFLDILDLHQGPGVYLVLAPSGETRQRLMAHWRNLAQTRGHRVVTAPYTTQSRAQDLLTLVGQTQERDVIFVDLDDELSWATANPTGLLLDLDQRVQQARQSLQSLNLARERLRRLPAPLFFWMSPEVLRAFARYAADLFAVRSGLLDVLGVPPARARATASDIERPEPEFPWLTHYVPLPRKEREGRLRLLLEALEREARRSQPNLYRLAHYHLDAAELLGSLEQYERALHHAQQALALARKVNDPALQAASWLAIGQGLAALGRYDEALRAIQQAGTLFEQVGDSLKRAHTLHQMANIYRLRGDLDPALNLYLQSLDLFERLGDLQGKAAILHEMAYIYRVRGELDRALNLYLQSLDLFERLGDLQGKAAILHNMASIYVLRGDLDRALELYRQSLAIDERLEDQRGKAATLHAMANIYATRGDLEAAIRTWQETLRIPYLPSGLREKIQADILQAVQSIEDEDARAEVLTALAPHLPKDLREQVLAAALAAARGIRDADDRARALAALAPYLPEASRLQRPDDEETRTIDAHRRARTDLSDS